MPESHNLARADLVEAIEQAADGIVIADTGGTIQYVNPAFTAMTGYTNEEAVGQNPRILKSERQSTAFYENLWRTIRSGETWQGELTNRRKDGSLYDEQMRIAPVRDSNGEIVSYIAIKHDVTERRAAEEARRFLAAIVESSDDAIFAFTPTGAILTWNRGAEALLGYSAGEAIGQQVSMLVPPERQHLLARLIERVREGNPVSQYEGMCLRQDGRRFDVSVTACPIRNSAGDVTAISIILRDISERREGEQARALLGSIVESSEDAIYAVKLDGTVVSWNRGAEMLFGYSGREIIGKNAAMLAPPGRAEEVRHCLGTVRTGQAITPFDAVLRGKDGREVDVSLSVSPIRNAAGEVVGASGIARDIGARLRAERKLREGEELFGAVFENAPVGMCVSSLDGRYMQVNAAFCRMLGYSAWEVVGKAWPELTHVDDLDSTLHRQEQLLTGTVEYVEGERRYLHRGGNVVWGRDRISLVRDSGGSPLYAVAHVEDVTERRRAEKALQESEARFRIMADGCPAILWVTDAEGEVQFFNRACLEFGGVRAEQVEGNKWQLGLHPDDAPAYVEALRAAVRNHAPFDDEARVRRVDGVWRWFATHAEPRLTADGEFLGHVGLSFDITERKQAEQAVKESEEKFRQLAENIREVFWMMSPETAQILYVSPAYEQVWGRTCESLYRNPMSWMESIHPEDLERAHETFAGQIRGEAVDSEYRIRTPDGREQWIRDRAFPIYDEDRQLIRIAGIAEDITERKRYEAELIRAREGADAANRAKSCFLANMSHEIRTPMNGVIGMLQLLGLTELTKDQRHYLDVAHTSGQTLLTLIDQILDLSRIEARKITLESRSFALRTLVEEVVQMISVEANAKGLPIHCHVAPEIPPLVAGDAHRLRQVLTNLTANAVKFTERGVVALDAAVESRGGSSAKIRFTVTDTGIGIREDQIAALFSPFTQADASTTRKYGGSGLGLAISKQIVELMGGTIGVESRKGRGSTFWFTAVFGLVRQPAAAPQASAPGDTPHEIVRQPGTGRILVVEDDPTSRDVAMAQLRKLGYRAGAVANGAEAVKAVECGGFDLVMMDCQMPVMDGFEAARRIRGSSRPAIANIPIIAVTADAMQDDRERCLREGMSDYLAKPVELGSLADTLSAWLPGSGPGDKRPVPPPPNGNRKEAGREEAGLEKPVFHEESLLRRLAGDRGLARTLLEGFLHDAPSQFRNLRERLKNGDAGGAGRQAHTLKGSAAAVGAEGLQAILRALEQVGNAGELDRCNQLYPGVVEEFERFESALAIAGWIGAGLGKDER